MKWYLSSFQFHLVRLKAEKECFWLLSLYKFQFHLVRLKVRPSRSGMEPDGGFQFHLVRLKVETRNKYQGRMGNFNSI